MNRQHLAQAIGLLIQGWLYINGESALGEALEIIQQECDDFALNLTDRKSEQSK